MNEVRAKAGGILSAAKMRMLEAEGITVVEKSRLDALERVAEAGKRQKKAANEFSRLMQPGGYMTNEENMALKRCMEAESEVYKAVSELESMDT